MSNEKLTVIDGLKYREVKRKAAVGERVKIVDGTRNGDGHHVVGDIKYVIYGNRWGNHSGVSVSFRKYVADEWNEGVGLNHDRYVVLEPIGQATEPPYPRVDIAADDVSLIVLTRKVNELAAQVDGLTGTVAKLAEKITKDDVKMTFDKPEKAPLTRDEIVAKAAADVAELLVTDIPYEVPTLSGGKQSYYVDVNAFMGACDTVDFVINRDKCTVVALVRVIDGEVWAKGIAKAAPGDVFNEIIGKAIALRRALGLPVPTEYVKLPKPEGVRVGDVYEAYSTGGSRFVKTVTEIASGKLYDSNFGGQAFTYIDAGDRYGAPCTNPAVIDDSARYDASGKVAE